MPPNGVKSEIRGNLGKDWPGQTAFHAAFAGPTIGERLISAGGRPAGFDYLRIGLSLVILFEHALQHEQTPSAFSIFMVKGPGYVLNGALVPMFFGLSGFLVAGSLDRTRSLVTFLGLRVLRIFPALWVDILFSALILGPLVTSLPIWQYLSSPIFHQYLRNLIGNIHYILPGVFTNNESPAVNGQLWTIPFELSCYATISIISLLGLHRKKVYLLSFSILLQLLTPIYYYRQHHYHLNFESLHAAPFPCFIIGTTFYLYRAQIIWNRTLFWLSIAAHAGTVWVSHSLLVITFVPIVYVTVYLGLTAPARLWIVHSGDYSYGVYLYHRPLQQTLWYAFPFARSWLGNLALSLPLTFAFAFLSWHLIEKRALKNRRRLYEADGVLAHALPLLSSNPPHPESAPR